ncbi:hypothetical protein ACFE04_019615 [Oxalis oulophora]
MPRLATEKETDSVLPLSEIMKLLLYFGSFAKDELFFIPRSESEGKARQKRDKFLMTAILSQAQSYGKEGKHPCSPKKVPVYSRLKWNLAFLEEGKVPRLGSGFSLGLLSSLRDGQMC